MTQIRHRVDPVVGPCTDPAAALAELTAALWAVREGLEVVLFRLVEQQLVLSRPGRRWLARTDDDLRAALGLLDDRDRDRLPAAAGAAHVLGLGPRPTLGELAGAAPEPWATVLADHRLALRVLLRDVDERAGAVGAQVRASARAVRETIDELRDSPAAPDPMGEFRAAERALLVHSAERTHRGALRTVARARRAELAAFVA